MRKMLFFYFGIFEKSPVREQERPHDRVRDHIVNSILVDPTGRVRMLVRLEKSSEIDIYYSANMEIVYSDLSGSMCKHPDYTAHTHTHTHTNTDNLWHIWFASKMKDGACEMHEHIHS